MIKFEYEHWRVLTSSVESPLYMVVDTEYDEDTSIAVKKTSVTDVMSAAKQAFEPEQIAILIASVNFTRKKCDKENPSHKKLPEEKIVTGLKRIFSKSNQFDSDELMLVFDELHPNEVEKVLLSASPIKIINDLLG